MKPEKNKYLVYTGNAYPHKNLDRLIDAVLLTQTNLKIISSRDNFIKRLEKMISDKRAGKYVELMGFVEDKKINEIYKNSIAFVFPTLDEGFGLPPMEAINAGTIAIVSDIPVLKEVYKNSVYYFNPLSVEAIAKSIIMATNLNQNERTIKIKKAQEFLKRYSWEKMSRETLKIYEEFGK